jgi:hypothetical protein
MRIKRVAASMFGAAMLFSAGTFAAPRSDSDFAALRGLEAQSLSAAEMRSISGELNAFDIAAALTAQAATLAKYPKLQAAALKLAAYNIANATAINAAFAKHGLLTPCKTC